MKILALDIETRPATAYVWRAYDENVSPSQVIDPGGVLCFAARFLGERTMHFSSDWGDSHDGMILDAHALLDEADAVLTYNGKRFDIPHLQREFMEAGLTPPSPYLQIDLYQTVRRQGRFFMNKLEHVAPQLGLKGKLQHEGFRLWPKASGGDKAAQRKMELYNKRDVTELEEAYEVLLPWVTGHPNVAALDEKLDACPRCSSLELRPQGFTVLASGGKYRRYRCADCGGWTRSAKRVEATTNVRSIPIS